MVLILLSNIPTVVFKTFPYSENKCDITKNTTRFNNEILKQRLVVFQSILQILLYH